jgi:hypothetical protein
LSGEDVAVALVAGDCVAEDFAALLGAAFASEPMLTDGPGCDAAVEGAGEALGAAVAEGVAASAVAASAVAGEADWDAGCSGSAEFEAEPAAEA